jgi:hypothetical protein
MRILVVVNRIDIISAVDTSLSTLSIIVACVTLTSLFLITTMQYMKEVNKVTLRMITLEFGRWLSSLSVISSLLPSVGRRPLSSKQFQIIEKRVYILFRRSDQGRPFLNRLTYKNRHDILMKVTTQAVSFTDRGKR